MDFKERANQCLPPMIKAGVLAVLFLPLVIGSNFFFPFIVPRNLLFRVLVEFMFAAYVILAAINPDYRPRFNKLVWAVVAFFSLTVISSFLGLNLYNSFWSNYERMGGLFHYLHLFLYFWVLFNSFKSDRDWRAFFSFSIFVSTVMCFIAFGQWLGLPFLLKSSGGTRLAATVGNATYLAAYLIFNIFFCLYFIAKSEYFNLKIFAFSFAIFDFWLVLASIFYALFGDASWGSFGLLKNLILSESFKYPAFILPFMALQGMILGAWLLRSRQYLIAILLAVITLFQLIIFWATQTRGAIIGLFFGILILVFVSQFSQVNLKIKRGALILLILMVLSPLFLWLGKNTALVKSSATLSRLANISMSDITTESRLTAWQASWRGWTENPKVFLLGYGPENYFFVFNKYFPPEIFKDAGSQVWFDRAHNIIFDIGITTGMIGLAAYLSIFGLAFWTLTQIYRCRQSLSSSWLFISLLTAYFVQNLFVFDMLNTEILFYLVLAFIAYQYRTCVSDEEKTLAPPADQSLNYILAALFFVALLFSLAVNFNTFKANSDLIKALLSRDLNEKVELFKKSIAESPIGRFEARQQAGSLAMELARSDKIAAEAKKYVINFATSELEKSIKTEPDNMRERLALAMVYNNVAPYDQQAPAKAVALLQDYIYLSPTRPQVYFELGQSYLLQGNVDKALSYFRQGVDLAPKVADSHWSLLSLYVFTNKAELAEKEFQSMQKILDWQPSVADYYKLIDIYSRVKNYAKMIEYGKKITVLEPSADNYAQLAIIYAKAGDNQKVRETAAKVVEKNPAAAAEVENFLKQVQAGEYINQ